METRARLQKVDCYHCGPEETTPYATENGYALVKCRRCGLLFVSPRPCDEEIEQAQVLGIHQGAASLNVTGRFSHSKARQYGKIMQDLYGAELLRGEKAWLDIGCGHGEFLLALRCFSQGKITASGVEPNDAKRQAAQTRGLEVLAGIPEDHHGKYSIVSLLNVYSHLPDPPAFITGLKSLLAAGGELLLETGDTAHLTCKEHYRPFYLPDHLSFASEEIVTNILGKAGFEIVTIRKRPFIPPGLIPIAKELIKMLMPGRQSRLKYILRSRTRNNTDMYIRARLRQ